MNDYWKSLLKQDLTKKKDDSLYRRLRIIGKSTGRTITLENKSLINFASNDYLGLLNNETVINSGIQAAQQWGAGSGASRLITGTSAYAHNIEQDFAAWIGKESALLYNSGYHANIGVLSALAGRDTIIYTDKLNHASIYDGIQLSRARMIRYNHNDMAHLAQLLKKHRDAPSKIIVADSVFSMEGDKADIKTIADLARTYGALTVIDEAHSFGIYGKNGAGLVAECDMMDHIDIVIGTFGKGFGSFGAIVLTSNLIREYLINNSRSFIFTTALPPFVLGAIAGAKSIIIKEQRGKTLYNRATKIINALSQAGINVHTADSQIIPVITGNNGDALSLMEYLKKEGYFSPAIRPPAVPADTARIRLSLSYAHTEEDINGLIHLLLKWHKKQYRQRKT